MEERKILFTTDATITFEEYVRYSNRMSLFRNILSYVLWIGITGALCVWAVYRGDYPKALMVAAVCISKVASSPAVRTAKQKKAFAEEDSVGNCYLVYDFYEDGFIMTCNMDPSELCHYWDLDTIVETRTNFYFRYNGDDGCIIIKENCSPELIHFLRTIKDDPKGPLFREGVPARLPGPADCFALPYEIIPWKESANDVVERYKRALQLAPSDGYPVIYENDEKTQAVLEDLEADPEWSLRLDEALGKLPPSDAQELLDELPDGRKLLEEWYREQYGKELQEDPLEKDLIPGDGSPEDPFIGPDVLIHAFDNDDLVMLKIPVDEPWKSLAFCPHDSWYADCKQIPELMAVGKYWYEKYGAVPAVFGCHIVEFWAEGVSLSKEDAWQLAKEQAALNDKVLEICTDSGTLEELAYNLRKTRTWYFMWE